MANARAAEDGDYICRYIDTIDIHQWEPGFEDWKVVFVIPETITPPPPSPP